jgi:hypothetical protein
MDKKFFSTQIKGIYTDFKYYLSAQICCISVICVQIFIIRTARNDEQINKKTN